MVLQKLRDFFGVEDEKPSKPVLTQPQTNESELFSLLERSRKAQQVLESFSQEQVDNLIRAVTWSCCEESVAIEIAKLAVQESKLGNFEGKFTKIFSKTRAALFDIINDKSVGIIKEDLDRQIVKIAKPVGVIFAVVPCTNPEATPVIKAINALKGRNSIIISPNSRTAYLNEFIVARMRFALAKCGAPEDLIIGIDSPSRTKTQFLLRNSNFNLVTGANSLVKAAYTSGTPSLGVGVGNAVIVVSFQPSEVDEISNAAENIARSKTFDFAASCSADNSVVALNSISNQVLDALQNNGGYLISNSADILKLTNTLFDLSYGKPRFKSEAIVKSAEFLAAKAEIFVPEGTKFLMVRHDRHQIGPKYPLSGEKLSPVLSFYTAGSIDEAIEITNELHEYQGKGHSCGIYSSNETHITRFASETYTARVMVNQPQSLSNSGALHNGMNQTLSLGCGTWGGNSTCENINWKHLVNFTFVSRPLKSPKSLPNDEDLFGKAIDLLN